LSTSTRSIENGGIWSDPIFYIEVALRGWRALLSAGLLGAVAGFVVFGQLERTYRSETVVVPVARDAGGGLLSSLRSQVGGLAQLAGFSMGGGGDKRVESLATLTSEGFAREFIRGNDLAKSLFAEEWDAEQKRWKNPDDAPSINDAVRKFSKEVVKISEDRRTGLVTLRVEWSDPNVSAAWANEMIAQINRQMQSAAIAEADKSIAYLHQEIAATQDVELRAALYRLVEAQIQNKVLASVQKDFAYKVIEPAVASDLDHQVRPRRLVVMILLSHFFGFIVFVYLIWREVRSARSREKGNDDGGMSGAPSSGPRR
jgi:uncharacterized protein involved in exopolysaccharide biosynthesis